MTTSKSVYCAILVIFAVFPTACISAQSVLPEPTSGVNTEELPIASDATAESLLVDVQATMPAIRVGLRYASNDNFTGAPLAGYASTHVYLRREAAMALARVARRSASESLALHVFDAYRPVRATLAMVEWAQRTGRQDLFRDGYIASRSHHNLGLAVDLTLLDAHTGVPLDMGTPFDTFSPSAHTANATGPILERRLRLKRLMESEGFVNYDHEWWHYSYSVPNAVRFDRVNH